MYPEIYNWLQWALSLIRATDGSFIENCALSAQLGTVLASVNSFELINDCLKRQDFLTQMCAPKSISTNTILSYIQN